MYLRTLTLLLLALIGSVGFAAVSGPKQDEDNALQALEGRWLYVQDTTEGRAEADQGPPMFLKFGLRVEDDAVYMDRGRDKEERITLDGTMLSIPGREDTTTRYTGIWRDGVLSHTWEVVNNSDGSSRVRITKNFRPIPGGLEVLVTSGEDEAIHGRALYQHPDDIELRQPAQASIEDVAWIAGNWTGTMGTSEIEERWTPPKGGAMLAVARTVKDGRMRMHEYLRIIERDGGLVYVAQPWGNPKTEFPLVEMDGKRLVFENPRHDSPQRITYELSNEGVLTATTGFIHGGKPKPYSFTREE